MPAMLEVCLCLLALVPARACGDRGNPFTFPALLPRAAMDDLEALVALAAAGPPEDGQAEPIEGPDPELADLHMLCQQGPEREPQRYERRSWQLLEKARLTKRALASERKLEEQTRKTQSALDALDAVRHTFPSVASIVGLPCPPRAPQPDFRSNGLKY